MPNSRRPWDLPQRLAPPEHLVFSRRAMLIGGASALAIPGAAMAQRVSDLDKIPDPSAGLYPAKRNETYKLDRPVTDERNNEHYSNFYYYVTDTDFNAAALLLQIMPWTIKIDGMVDKPSEIGVYELM